MLPGKLVKARVLAFVCRRCCSSLSRLRPPSLFRGEILGNPSATRLMVYGKRENLSANSYLFIYIYVYAVLHGLLGEKIKRSRYCLRREIRGQCIRERESLSFPWTVGAFICLRLARDHIIADVVNEKPICCKRSSWLRAAALVFVNEEALVSLLLMFHLKKLYKNSEKSCCCTSPLIKRTKKKETNITFANDNRRRISFVE